MAFDKIMLIVKGLSTPKKRSLMMLKLGEKKQRFFM